MFKAKERPGDETAAANLPAPCSVINHRSTREKKSKLDPVPILVNYFQEILQAWFFTRKQLQFNIEDHRIHMELISISFCSAYTRECNFQKALRNTQVLD